MKNTTLRTLATFLILSISLSLCAQTQKRYLRVCIGFYNLENLFDTINQEEVRDEEFLPEGTNHWNSEKYLTKLQRMSEVICKIGGDGPEILGISEVENRTCIEDLIATPLLKDLNYGIVHFDSPEARGVDAAFIYRKDVLQLTEAKAHRTIVPEEPHFKTRDVVQMSGTIDGELFHFLVSHWSSRSGGEKVSEHRRMGFATTMKRVADSLQQLYPDSKVVLMGDFNDDPVDKSLTEGLQINKRASKTAPHELFTPMWQMYRDGLGSLAYRDSWNLFDILVVNGNLLGGDYSSFKVLPNKKSGHLAYIFKQPFMLQKEGQYKGYPWRTFVSGQWQGGYSDHFPVYLYVVKEID